jgi:hypothetical protein
MHNTCAIQIQHTDYLQHICYIQYIGHSIYVKYCMYVVCGIRYITLYTACVR